MDHLSFFFFQAEDGIRDLTVTGVQTCALPISRLTRGRRLARFPPTLTVDKLARRRQAPVSPVSSPAHHEVLRPMRSEEHTSELQSQSNLVCRLLLETKKPTHTHPPTHD